MLLCVRSTALEISRDGKTGTSSWDTADPEPALGATAHLQGAAALINDASSLCRAARAPRTCTEQGGREVQKQTAKQVWLSSVNATQCLIVTSLSKWHRKIKALSSVRTAGLKCQGLLACV